MLKEILSATHVLIVISFSLFLQNGTWFHRIVLPAFASRKIKRASDMCSAARTSAGWFEKGASATGDRAAQGTLSLRAQRAEGARRVPDQRSQVVLAVPGVNLRMCAGAPTLSKNLNLAKLDFEGPS